MIDCNLEDQPTINHNHEDLHKTSVNGEEMQLLKRQTHTYTRATIKFNNI